MILVANWKMAPVRLRDATSILRQLEPAAKSTTDVRLWIAPPSLFLAPLQNEFGHSFSFGLQDVGAEREGAFTGELSPLMAKDLGVIFTILGHSERKRLGETTAITNRKLRSALAAGLRVILCFGEQLRPRQLTAKHMALTWQSELKALLKGIRVTPITKRRLTLAFEPAWAISTNKRGGLARRSLGEGGAPRAYLEEFLAWYRKHYRFPVLYGGSVDSKIIETYRGLGFDGYLIGAASRNPKELTKIINSVSA